MTPLNYLLIAVGSLVAATRSSDSSERFAFTSRFEETGLSPALRITAPPPYASLQARQPLRQRSGPSNSG